MTRQRATGKAERGHRALEVLYEDHAGRVLAYLLHRTDRDTAEDILSETFLLAWRKAGAVPADALPWLLASARRLLANRVRSEQRYRALTERLASVVDRAPSEELADVIATRAEVAAALASLSEQDREAVTLNAWYGLTAKQAAVVLGCTVTAYAVRLHRARKRFRAALDRAHLSGPAPTTHHFAQQESA